MTTTLTTLFLLRLLTRRLKIVFIFYETDKPGLTTDHLVYHGDSFVEFVPTLEG
jgi:hypothetical protein